MCDELTLTARVGVLEERVRESDERQQQAGEVAHTTLELAESIADRGDQEQVNDRLLAELRKVKKMASDAKRLASMVAVGLLALAMRGS